VRMLIDAGADVNASSKMIVRTPLAMAADTGDLETVKLLLLKGASPDAPVDEAPPLYYALKAKHYEIARLLITADCDFKRIYSPTDQGYTIGDLTIWAQRPELTEIVRNRGGVFASRSNIPVENQD
ncbi:MAG TPA: ankyrin repeat domain-containing protein, partial [Syntrophorhabdaceae bacterium]|nr:ankyrin repeat domain-containing protein [Syntrophorhabdaceae bacterium]